MHVFLLLLSLELTLWKLFGLRIFSLKLSLTGKTLIMRYLINFPGHLIILVHA